MRKKDRKTLCKFCGLWQKQVSKRDTAYKGVNGSLGCGGWNGAAQDYNVIVKYSGGKGKTYTGQDEGIDLIDMKFVEPGRRPGHEGLFPVKGKVRSGQSLLCNFKITGKVSEPVAEFLSCNNRILGRVVLQPVPESDGEFLATCTVLAVPFRTRVSGRDIDGYPFQRVTSALYTPAR